ncbi:MAG: hypothetical protein R2862_12935 [Thermoanaerobaculia bacterium]
MTVTSAEFYSNRTAEGASPAVAPAARYFVFLFDDQRGRGADVPGLFNRQVNAGRDARAFVAGSLTPTDWVAVLRYDHRLRLYSDFTRDRERLDRAIEAATTGSPTAGPGLPGTRRPKVSVAGERPAHGRRPAGRDQEHLRGDHPRRRGGRRQHRPQESPPSSRPASGR